MIHEQLLRIRERNLQMAHNIFNERFYSLRAPAWHGLGTIGQEEQTAAEIFNTMTPYIVTLEPVFTKIGNLKLELPNKVITRHPIPDDNAYRSFGIVGPDYSIVDPLKTCEIYDEATKKPVETLGVLGQGESLFITTKLPSFAITSTKRGFIVDDVDSYLLLHSPYGDGAIQVRVTPVRVVCQNTLIAAKAASTESFRIIHDQHVEERMASWMSGIVERATAKSEGLAEAFNLMASTDIDEELATEALKRIYVDPRKPSYVPDQSVMTRREKAYEATVKQNVVFRENVMEVWNGRGTGMDTDLTKGTVWGLYNSVVEWEDYRPTSQDDSRSYNVLWGDRSLRKESAYAELFQYSVENQS
jgi:phage/plasmid-like protein (TIGR03299 family)